MQASKGERMNRRGFFKFLGIGAAAAVVAPKMLADICKSEPQYKFVQVPGMIDKSLLDIVTEAQPLKEKQTEMMRGTPTSREPYRPKPSVCYYIADSPTSGLVKSYIWKR